MRRKKLKNVANTVCQMFCGWRLHASKPMLVILGSGNLVIDVLSGRCQFNGHSITQLPIARELVEWVKQDLARSRIPAVVLTRAHVAVKLSFSQVPWNTKTKHIFYKAGKAVLLERMHKCVFECESEVTTKKAAYHSKLVASQEWPVDWPSK